MRGIWRRILSLLILELCGSTIGNIGKLRRKLSFIIINCFLGIFIRNVEIRDIRGVEFVLLITYTLNYL